LVEGATLSEVAGLPPRDVLLFFRDVPQDGGSKGILRLRVSADADGPRLFVQTARQQRHDGPLGPFFRRLAADLTGATLRRVEQVARDRIVRLDFTATPCGETRALLAELTGRHANLVLLGPNERVLEVLVPGAPRKDKPARLTVGAAWQAPPGAARALDEGASLGDALGAAPVDAEARPHPRAPLSFLVQEKLGGEVAEIALHRARRDLGERVERKLSRARSLVHGLEQRVAAADDAERVRLDGEALKSSMHLVRRGANSVRVPDPFGEPGAEREVAVDPRKSPQSNVEQLFERYKKLVRARETVAAELELARERVRDLAELRARIDASDDLAALETESVERGLLEPAQQPDERKRKAPEPRRPYKTFVGSKGSEIRVGRSAEDNDELSLRHCRGNDVWLHTADAPGSHVVLVLARNAEPDPDEVLDAAHLAVHFSPLRGAHKAMVHVARGKDVHKPRGAKPGLVHLSGGKTLGVRTQPERLKRLLDGART
jgi:predicted ribosome quality control (RQC) complex YloA/Tae2 family protein